MSALSSCTVAHLGGPRPSHHQGPRLRGCKVPHLGFCFCWPGSSLGANLESTLAQAAVWPQREWSVIPIWLPGRITVKLGNVGTLPHRVDYAEIFPVKQGDVKGSYVKYI